LLTFEFLLNHTTASLVVGQSLSLGNNLALRGAQLPLVHLGLRGRGEELRWLLLSLLGLGRAAGILSIINNKVGWCGLLIFHKTIITECGIHLAGSIMGLLNYAAGTIFATIVGYLKNWVSRNLVQGGLAARCQVREGGLATGWGLLSGRCEVISLLALLLL